MPSATTAPHPAQPRFTGLCAFPLTPLQGGQIDEAALARLVGQLVAAGVDSIGALGSTGNYAYLSHAERARAARVVLEHADGVPVIVGIGALRLREVLALAHDAQRAGASGVLLAPVSYQPLTEEEVFGLYAAVTRELSVPLVVYDNPGTTHFTFSDALHARIAALAGVASIKLPPVPADPGAAQARVRALRALIPAHVTLGISGDASAVTGLAAGCDAWYSAIGGLFPVTAMAITHAMQTGNQPQARQQSDRLAPLWDLFRRHGSLRVIATAAELLEQAEAPSLPLPLLALAGDERAALARTLQALHLS